jgi:hypothetical protein
MPFAALDPVLPIAIQFLTYCLYSFKALKLSQKAPIDRRRWPIVPTFQDCLNGSEKQTGLIEIWLLPIM